MNPVLSPKQIGRRLAETRRSRGLSQEDLARSLGIHRSSVAQLELGNRTISAIELVKISEILGFTLDKFLSAAGSSRDEIPEIPKPAPAGKEMRISVPRLKPDKLVNTVLYILGRCGGKPNVGETALYKLLYFSDFDFYELYEEHLTGAKYRKLSYGPVPQHLDTILLKMIEKGQLQRIKTEYHGLPQTRFIPLETPDLTKMSAAEKETIDRVIDRFSDWSASALSDYSHRDLPWKATENGAVIDYELAFYREQPFSVRTYANDAEVP